MVDAEGNADAQTVRRQSREPGTSVRGGYEVRLFLRDDSTTMTAPVPDSLR